MSEMKPSVPVEGQEHNGGACVGNDVDRAGADGFSLGGGEMEDVFAPVRGVCAALAITLAVGMLLAVIVGVVRAMP
jgi:hypothetical protein